MSTFQLHRTQWSMAVASCALTAALIVSGDFLDDATAEDLAPVVASLQRWTTPDAPQERFGMLLPLLARPVRSPFGNLLLQGWLGLFGALLTFVLGARVLSHRPGAPLAGVITATLFLATTSRELLHAFASPGRPYGPALALTFGGMVALDHVPVTRRRTARLVLGVALLTLGLFVSLRLVLLFAPYLVLRAWPQVRALRRARRPVRTWWRDPAVFPLLALALATVVNLLTARWGATVASLSVWHAWTRFFAHTSGLLSSSWLLVLGMASGALIVFIAVPSPRGITREELSSAAIAVGVAVTAWLLIGTFDADAGGAATPPLVFAFVAVVGFAFTRITVTPRLRLALMGLCLAVLLASAGQQYGAPSLARLRASMDRFGHDTPALLRLQATHVSGDEATVWPAVFHAALVRSEQDLSGVLYGLTSPAAPARGPWPGWPAERFRVAVRDGDLEGLRRVAALQLGALVAARRTDGWTVYAVATRE